MLMKTLIRIFFSGVLMTVNAVQAQQVIVTDDANYTTPASSSVLDVKSTSKGFLPPRVALNSTKDVTTIASPTNGLLIYNTGAGTLTDKGLYFWQDSVWVKPISCGISTATNGITIANDGNVRLHGTATAWNDFIVNPATARNNGGIVPLWTVFVAPNVYTWVFEDTKTQEVDFTVQLPHNYREGSTIYPHIHWSSTSAPGAGRVRWVLDYQWVNLGSNFAATGTTSVYGTKVVPSDAASLTAFESNITPMNTGGVDNTGIVGTGKKISSILVCHLYRDGTHIDDTFSGSAYLLSIDFHYEIDSFGSNSEFIK